VQHRRALPFNRGIRLTIELVTTVGSALLLSYLILSARW
jgi:hypothetical protein